MENSRKEGEEYLKNQKKIKSSGNRKKRDVKSYEKIIENVILKRERNLLEI